MEDGGDDGWMRPGTVCGRILGAARDFDPRSYGCANLSKLAENSGGFEVRKGSGNTIHIRRMPDAGGTAGKAAPPKGGKGRIAATGGDSVRVSAETRDPARHNERADAACTR